MSTLYIRLPARVVADSAPLLLAWACPYAQVSESGNIEREGVECLSGLSEMIARIQRVALLLDGSNITLLRVKVPPLSAARLKAALPSLVEEQLLCDPLDCVIVAGALHDGLRTLAVMQRAWLALLDKIFSDFGALHIAVLPAQLCLSCPSDQLGCVAAAINQRNTDIDITLRLSEQEGIGLVIGPVLLDEGDDERHAVAQVAIQSLCAVVPAAPIVLYVPPSLVSAYQQAAALNKRISILADNWSHWIAGARLTSVDLMEGLGAGAGAKLDWHSWRWPLALAATLVLLNAAALNIDWWRMQRESNALSTLLIQSYKSAYPKESVILDPLLQMQQKYAAAKRNAGQIEADDFTAIAASFGEAWASIVPPAGKALATISVLEYREHSLFVHLTLGGEVPAKEMIAAVALRGLSLDRVGAKSAPDQSSAVVWRIRSAK